MSAARDSGDGSNAVSSATEILKKRQSSASDVPLPSTEPPASLAEIRAQRPPEPTEVFVYAEPGSLEKPRAGLQRTHLQQDDGQTSLSAHVNAPQGTAEKSATTFRDKARGVERTAKLDQEIPRLLAMKEAMQKNFFGDASTHEWEDTLITSQADAEDLQTEGEDIVDALEHADALEHTLSNQEISQELQDALWLEETSNELAAGTRPDNAAADDLDETKEIAPEHSRELAEMLQADPPAMHSEAEVKSEAGAKERDSSEDAKSADGSDGLLLPDELLFPDVLDIGEVQQDDGLNDTLVLKQSK